MFGTSISKITDQLAAHENIADIDHAYIMFGVSPDTKDQACLEYLYRFFLHLRDAQ